MRRNPPMTEIGFGFWRKTPSTRQLHRNYHLQRSLGGAIESDTQYCIHEPYLSHHQDRLDICVSMEMTDGDGIPTTMNCKQNLTRQPDTTRRDTSIMRLVDFGKYPRRKRKQRDECQLHHSGDLLDCQSAVISLAFSHIITAPLLEHPTLNTKESDRTGRLYPDEGDKSTP
jgi:hypothetical protein